MDIVILLEILESVGEHISCQVVCNIIWGKLGNSVMLVEINLGDYEIGYIHVLHELPSYCNLPRLYVCHILHV